MQEKIQQFAQMAIANKKVALLTALGVVAIIAGVVTMSIPAKDPLALASRAAGALSPEVELAIVGAADVTDTPSSGNSWPGELVSLGSIPIQPPREGTISSWDVHVGQKVYAGEVLGTLSQPPAMPDTVAMLAEKAGDAAMSRASVEAKRTYVAERIKELDALRENTKQSLVATQTLLGGGVGGGRNLSMIAAKGEVVRAILRSTLAKTYPIFSGSIAPPTKWSSVTLISSVGQQNARLREQFASVYFAAKNDIDTAGKSPAESGLAYYDLAIKLADASLPDGAMMTDGALVELKTILHEDQQAFVMALDEEKKAELMAVDTQKASFEQLREIDNEIAMLKQDLAMAEGEVSAKETVYQTVQSGVQGKLAITTPKNGTVSSITKKVGEFVGPGMPIAVVTGDKKNDYVVRFRIPSNVRKPEIGQEFFVTRSGFPQVMPRAKLIGVGNSLDDTGSVMADALLLEPVDWPVGVSLRVMMTAHSDTIEVALSSVWWDAKSNPNVWAVSEAGRVYAQKVLLGRTLGERVEVYDGLTRGDHYIVRPVPEISEDMLLGDIQSANGGKQSESSYEAAMRAMGM